jgi:hypothetical protein
MSSHTRRSYDFREVRITLNVDIYCTKLTFSASELCNHIQSMCTERILEHQEGTLPNTPSHDIYRPKYLALTQTCTQLKAEFRPIYMRSNVAIVDTERP